LVRMADKAARTYAHAEATTVLRDALVLVGRVPAGRERERMHVELALRLAEAQYFLGRFQEGVDLLVQQQDRLAELGDPRLSGPRHFWLSFFFTRLNEHERAVESALRAVAEGERCGDAATAGKAQGVLGVEAYWAGDCRRSVEHAQRGVTLL